MFLKNALNISISMLGTPRPGAGRRGARRESEAERGLGPGGPRAARGTPGVGVLCPRTLSGLRPRRGRRRWLGGREQGRCGARVGGAGVAGGGSTGSETGGGARGGGQRRRGFWSLRVVL